MLGQSCTHADEASACTQAPNPHSHTGTYMSYIKDKALQCSDVHITCLGYTIYAPLHEGEPTRLVIFSGSTSETCSL